MRRVSKFHFCQSLPFVAVCRLPYTKTPAFFISARDNFDLHEHAIEAALQPPQSSANAQARTFTTPQYKNQHTSNNRFVYDVPRYERNVVINTDNSYNNNNNNNINGATCNVCPGQRIFLGQLRRNGTVPMIQ